MNDIKIGDLFIVHNTIYIVYKSEEKSDLASAYFINSSLESINKTIFSKSLLYKGQVKFYRVKYNERS